MTTNDLLINYIKETMEEAKKSHFQFLKAFLLYEDKEIAMYNEIIELLKKGNK